MASEATQVYRCEDCELIYPDPFPQPNPTRLQEQYGLAYDTGEERVKASHYRRLLRVLSRFVPQRGKLLDVGCGEGHFMRIAETAGWRAYGVDVSQTFVKQAQQRVRGTVWLGELQEQHLPSHEFDAVSLYALLEHVPEPGMLLREAKRILKPTGILYFKVPNDAALVSLVGDWYYHLRGLGFTTHLSPTVPPYHLYGFTPKTVRSLAAYLQCDLLACRVFNDGPSPFRHHTSLRDRVETLGYDVCHHVGGWSGRGISIEAFLRPAAVGVS